MVGLFGRKLGLFCMAAVMILALSGCKTMSRSLEAKVEYLKDAIEESLISEDWSIGVQIIRRSNAKIISELEPWLEDRAHTFPPVYLYAMSDRIYKNDKESATRWYVAARVRHAYDLVRCKDRRAVTRLRDFEGRFRKTVFKFIRDNPDEAYELGLNALEWDRESPIHRMSPMKECMLVTLRSGRHPLYSSSRHAPLGPFSDIYYPAALHVNESDWVRPVWQHPKLLEVARRMTADFVDDLRREEKPDDDEFDFPKKKKNKKKKRKGKNKSDQTNIERWQEEEPASNIKPWRKNSNAGQARSGDWVPLTQ